MPGERCQTRGYNVLWPVSDHWQQPSEIACTEKVSQKARAPCLSSRSVFCMLERSNVSLHLKNQSEIRVLVFFAVFVAVIYQATAFCTLTRVAPCTDDDESEGCEGPRRSPEGQAISVSLPTCMLWKRTIPHPVPYHTKILCTEYAEARRAHKMSEAAQLKYDNCRRGIISCSKSEP